MKVCSVVVAMMLLISTDAEPRCASSATPEQTQDCGALAALWVATGQVLPWDGGDYCTAFRGVSCNMDGRVYKINLHDKGVTGEIPPAIGALSELHYLSLSENSFQGKIPPELAALSELVALNLEGNALTGALPAELGSLQNLKYMIMRKNHFEGDIPATFAHMHSIQQISLEGNPALTSHKMPAAHLQAAAVPVDQRSPSHFHRGSRLGNKAQNTARESALQQNFLYPPEDAF
jgi:hypothetical protein